MTIEKLLGYKTSELKAMSDKDLLLIFAPYLKATRLEMMGKERKTPVKRIKKASGPTNDEVKAAKEKANAIAKSMGLGNVF